MGCPTHTHTLHKHSVEVSSEWHCPGTISRVLGEWAVELLAGEGVDSGPAVLTVVLEAADRAAVEGGKLAIALDTMALVTHLVIHHVRLHFHLHWERKRLALCMHVCTRVWGWGWAVKTNPFVDIPIRHLEESRGNSTDEAVG